MRKSVPLYVLMIHLRPFTLDVVSREGTALASSLIIYFDLVADKSKLTSGVDAWATLHGRSDYM
jgi:hypothetical protein